MATRRRRLLTTVVAKGDYRQSLEALRDHLAGMLDAGDGNAATAKQLTEVLKLLEALPTGKERTIDDELSDRRARRGAPDAQHGAEGSEVARGRRSGPGRARRSTSG